jgi:hypothetical protein
MTTETKSVETIDGFSTIENIINAMDFEKIHAYMKLTNWQWSGRNGLYIPTVEQLKDCAENNLWLVLNNGRNNNYTPTSCGNGGFTATYFIFSNKECIRIAFCIANGSNY